MLRIDEFLWDEWNIEHIARHRVKQEEIEQVFDSKYYLRKMWGQRYIALGTTEAGRYLFVVVEYEHSKVYVITARNMSEREKRFYRKR